MDLILCYRRGLIDAIENKSLFTGTLLRLTVGDTAYREYISGYRVGVKLLAGLPPLPFQSQPA